MTDIRLLDGVNADAESSARLKVGGEGGVNVYASFTSLGGGTLNIYECPNLDLKPNQPVYSSTTGAPEHLNVSKDSYLLGELTGATSPSDVVLGVTTLQEA